MLKVIGHGQALGLTPINICSELINVKIKAFEVGYYTVRIEELRHTKHPV